MRVYSGLTPSHQKQLKKMMADIDEWAWDAASRQQLEFNIASYSLKKALAKQVTKNYIGTGIFTNYSHNSNKTVVKKV